MTSRYAESTAVPVERSQQELARVLRAAGAGQIVLAWDEHHGAGIRFRLAGSYAQLMVPPPTHERMVQLRHWRRTWSDQQLAEQEQRRMWRALILLVKAKLEAIASGVSTMQREFMPDLLMADGRRLEEWATPELESRPLPALPA